MTHFRRFQGGYSPLQRKSSVRKCSPPRGIAESQDQYLFDQPSFVSRGGFAQCPHKVAVGNGETGLATLQRPLHMRGTSETSPECDDGEKSNKIAISRLLAAEFRNNPAGPVEGGSRPEHSPRAFWEWTGAGSNRRHLDFQSSALPTELPVPLDNLEAHAGRVTVFSYRLFMGRL